jgi:hypothetical protein
MAHCRFLSRFGPAEKDKGKTGTDMPGIQAAAIQVQCHPSQLGNETLNFDSSDL